MVIYESAVFYNTGKNTGSVSMLETEKYITGSGNN